MIEERSKRNFDEAVDIARQHIGIGGLDLGKIGTEEVE